jgi:PPK2 family polyphosphate:nucleotide phosphotransferase
MSLAHRVDRQHVVRLGNYDPGDTGGLSHKQADARLARLGEELDELQELLYAAGQHALLVVLQGMDTSGKDGAIRHVFRYVDPQGCRVQGFKVPTELELRHDFLWRIHAATPEKGMIVVFNRSHYEDVVTVRVRSLAPEAVWRRRYDLINAFEQQLTDNQTIVVKFFLHISRSEQEERLRAREEEVEKAWKLSAGDWVERRAWEDYIAAYEDALRLCSTENAPWYIVPADKKWFRDVAVAETVVAALRPYREGWLAALHERGQRELAAIDAARQARAASTSGD